MMHANLDSVLGIINELTNQLNRTIDIVHKQNNRIESLEERVNDLEISVNWLNQLEEDK